jgi:eukaryotic-like serine/threonine-protein kinase
MAEPQKEAFEGEVLDENEDVRDEELLFDDATDWGSTEWRPTQPRTTRSISSRPPKANRRPTGFVEGDVLAGKYRVERLVSSNGMTGVLHARHEEAEQRVVLKYLLPDVCSFPDIVARFLRGARAALQIRSEHAARILDVGRFESGAPYFAMEYLRGWALSEVIRVRGPLPVPDAVDYVVQACEAVAEAHVLGFAHRNLNMSTVLLTRRPDHSALIKVLDFGASESLVVDPYGDDSPMVDAKAFLESLPYTSPEQIRNTNDIDARADVWAMGTILYELLAGSPLYRGDTAPALMAMIVADPALPITGMRPDVPLDLEAVILRCVEKDRNARFSNVAELALALRPFAAEDGLPAVDRISRMVGRGTRPPLFSHTRALVHVPPPPKRTPLPPPPAAPVGKRDRLVPIAMASIGILGGAIVGALVGVKASRDIQSTDPALTSQAFAATPAALVPPVPFETAAPAVPLSPVQPPAAAPGPPPPREQQAASVARPTRTAAREHAAGRALDPEAEGRRIAPRLEDPFDDDVAPHSRKAGESARTTSKDNRDARISQKSPEATRVSPKGESPDDLFGDVR